MTEAALVYGSPEYVAITRVLLGPDGEHRRISKLDPRYRTFAMIAHLRDEHGMAEVMPERAAGAHLLLTEHECVLAAIDAVAG